MIVMMRRDGFQDLSEQHLQENRNASDFAFLPVSQVGSMAKVISTLLSILLLVFADQMALYLKRSGRLSTEGKTPSELKDASKHDVRMAANQHRVYSMQDGGN